MRAPTLVDLALVLSLVFVLVDMLEKATRNRLGELNGEITPTKKPK